MNEEQTAHLVTSVLLSYSRIALLGTRTGLVDSLANRDKRLFAFNSICSSHSGPRRVKGLSAIRRPSTVGTTGGGQGSHA